MCEDVLCVCDDDEGDDEGECEGECDDGVCVDV